MKTPIGISCAGSRSGTTAVRSVLMPLEDNIIQYMPGGIHSITPSQNGRPVTVTVKVEAATASALENQRKVLTAGGKKPYFSIGDDSHASDKAAFWPTRFFWDKRLDATGSLVEGVWAEGEWTSTGRDAVEGKEFRTFSPTFFVSAIRNDPENPVDVICCEDARANMGALVNDPAFEAMSPLWCKNASTQQSRSLGNKNAGAPGSKQPKTGNKMETETQETVAELQSRKEKLELTIAGLQAKDDALSKAELRASRFELQAVEADIRLQNQEERNKEIEARETKRLEEQADTAVTAMVKSGAIGPRDMELQATYKKKFTADPELIKLVGPKAESTAPARTVTGRETMLDARGNGGAVGTRVDYMEDTVSALKKYAELIAANANINVLGLDYDDRSSAYRQKGRYALEAAVHFKNVLLPMAGKWEHMPITEMGKRVELKAGAGNKFEIRAADYSNDNAPSNVLGVLSGTLVLQRTLPVFAFQYPELMALFTDFSDTPGMLNQTETTRIVLQPAVQKYDPTTDGTGRPKGWSTISQAQTTDASLTLTDYIAVPINFGNNVLAATTRKLFDEQAVLAVKALAGYFVAMLTNIFTAANFNSYAVGGTQAVPNAYPTYVKDIMNFTMADLDLLDAAFTSNKVPENDRGIFLNPLYYSKLRGDPRLEFMYAASAKDVGAGAGQFVTEAKLPKLSGFAPYKAPYLQASAPTIAPTTNNIVGFAFQKAAAILKSRLPQDFTQALGVMIPGSVTTITDPDTMMSIMLVQYVSLQGGWAEWRPEVILGVAKGDARAGLVMTGV